jgi:hypothetical protein
MPSPCRPLRAAPTCLALLVALTAALTAALPAAAADAAGPAADRFTCDASTSLVLVGMDTLEGRLLFRAAGGPTGPAGWSVETAPAITRDGGGAESAVYHPPLAGPPPYGGSIGPGPVFAVRDCGPSCLEPVRWEGGRWVAFADRLTAPDAATVHTTWDGRGRPWIVLQASGPAGRGVTAWAFYLEGREWVPAGTQRVIASGSSEAVPDPGDDGAVRSGTGRFTAGEEPGPWLAAVPRVGPARGGVLVPVLGGAAFLTDDGSLYLSEDGTSWARTRWTPWGKPPTRIWTPGRDYTVDVAAADHRGSLPVIWFDRRRPEEERLLITEWSPDGWQLLAELAPGVTTLDGQSLPYTDFFAVRPGQWVLLAGCVNTANGPGLVLRTLGPGGHSRARFLALRPGGSVEAAVPLEPLEPPEE